MTLAQFEADPEANPSVLADSAGPSSTFADLLERAGFRIRGRRADCPHCQGHSRLTVSFNDEVAFCHRCQWRGNVRTLSRELCVPIAPETQEHRERRAQAARFSAWANNCYMILVSRLRHLTVRAELAKNVLIRFPDCEPGWGALANFYHNEASLLGALDFLAFEKLSPWLEQGVTQDCVALAFNEACAHVGVADAN